VFVNGQASEAAEVGTPGPASQLRVGGFHGYPFLRGALDEVRLSQGVRYRSAFTPPAAPFSVDGQTEALYHFDEGSGQSLTDASGRGRDLTLGTSADADAADLDWISPGVFAPPPTATPTPSPTAIPLTGVGFLASSYVPSSVSGFRTPQLPLLPLWEKGVGGMRGNGAPESRKSLIPPKKSTLESRHPLPHRHAHADADSYRHPPHRGRFFGKPLRAISHFSHQDAQTPPSPLVGEGGRGDEGQRRAGMQNVAHLSQKLYT
jgi:hypothetical protein